MVRISKSLFYSGPVEKQKRKMSWGFKGAYTDCSYLGVSDACVPTILHGSILQPPMLLLCTVLMQ